MPPLSILYHAQHTLKKNLCHRGTNSLLVYMTKYVIKQDIIQQVDDAVF